MGYFARAPLPPLDAFIERLWCIRFAGDHALARERVLPGGGTVDLVVNLADDEVCVDDPAPRRLRSGAVVAGPRTRSYFADPRQQAAVIGVHFKPGGAAPFLGVSPSELVDAHVELGDLWGDEGRSLRDRLLSLSSTAARLGVLEQVLLARLQIAPLRHPAVPAAVAAFRSHGRVADVAAFVGLGRRRFLDVFERDVGLAPKLYARLRRFHLVKRRIAECEPASWSALAADCGYFDQSHMIRDFTDIAGLGPGAYLRARDDEARLDHVVHASADNRDASL